MKSRIQRCYTKDCQNIFRKLRNLALLEDNQALKGRQNTDGGATPGHVPLPPPYPLPRVAREGVLLTTVPGGCALLAPVCNLSPLFPVALPRAHLQG